MNFLSRQLRVPFQSRTLIGLGMENVFPIVVASLYLPKARELGNETVKLESFTSRWQKERSDIRSKRTRFEACRALNSTQF